MVARIGAFGKLPLHGDFIRVGQGVPELAELDTWLQEGMYRDQQSMGADWAAAFDALPPLRFVFHSPASRGLLIAASCASRDRTGRRYPFMIGARIDTGTADLTYEQLPVAFDGFLDAAIALTSDGHEGVDLPSFTAEVGELSVHPDASGAAHRVEDYLANHSGDELWNEVLPGTEPPRRATLLQELHELLRPPFPPKLVLHLPTTGDVCEVAFWLSVVRRWMPTDVFPSLALWSAGDGRLRLVFDRLMAKYLEPAWWPARDNDYGYDLAHVYAPRPAQVENAVSRFGALASGGGTLHEMQKSLHEVGAR